MPKGTSCCSACTSSRSTSAPVLMAPEHQPVVHHEGLAGPGGWWQQLQSYPSRCWARRGGSSMCPDRLILYTKCALMCLQGLSGQNHVGIPVRAHRGCALTCALKNRAYGASVPAGGVCLQGQFDGSLCRPQRPQKAGGWRQGRRLRRRNAQEPPRLARVASATPRAWKATGPWRPPRGVWVRRNR